MERVYFTRLTNGSFTLVESWPEVLETFRSSRAGGAP